MVSSASAVVSAAVLEGGPPILRTRLNPIASGSERRSLSSMRIHRRTCTGVTPGCRRQTGLMRCPLGNPKASSMTRSLKEFV